MRVGRLVSITASMLLAVLAAGGGPAVGQTGFPPFAQAGLEAHNMYRARHGTPPMALTQDLVTRAQQCAQYYAGKGTIDHSCPYKNGAGENLYFASGGSPDAVQHVKAATQGWYNEIKDYDFNNPGFDYKTGHFTQLVWKASTQLGIGFDTKNNKHFVVALYKEPGNLNTREAFQENVPRPR